MLTYQRKAHIFPYGSCLLCVNMRVCFMSADNRVCTMRSRGKMHTETDSTSWNFL